MASVKTKRAPSRPGPRRERAPDAGWPALNIRIDLSGDFRLGPGKVRLMELIAEHGSISAAGRAMGMSYRRAWLLVDSLNAAFREPLVVSRTGGTRGGGAGLTKFGRSIVERYRAIEAEATATAHADLRVLVNALSPEHA
jgi:molybdate transport system regulatory protein